MRLVIWAFAASIMAMPLTANADGLVLSVDGTNSTFTIDGILTSGRYNASAKVYVTEGDASKIEVGFTVAEGSNHTLKASVSHDREKRTTSYSVKYSYEW